jgi:hypothetical protein
MFRIEVSSSQLRREDTLYLGAFGNMGNININDLISDSENLQELNEQKSRQIVGGRGTSQKTKTIGIPVEEFPPGEGGCPACLSGYDPRFDETA